jgi:hypothetical protein
VCEHEDAESQSERRCAGHERKTRRHEGNRSPPRAFGQRPWAVLTMRVGGRG